MGSTEDLVSADRASMFDEYCYFALIISIAMRKTNSEWAANIFTDSRPAALDGLPDMVRFAAGNDIFEDHLLPSAMDAKAVLKAIVGMEDSMAVAVAVARLQRRDGDAM